MDVEQSYGAVVFFKNKEPIYLLLHYEASHWGLVKGHMENNETQEETALRELKEETGLTKIKLIAGFKEKINYFYKRKNQTIHKQVTYFLVQTYHKEINLSSEHIGYEWLNHEEATEKLSFKNTKNVLKKAHNYLKNK